MYHEVSIPWNIGLKALKAKYISLPALGLKLELPEQVLNICIYRLSDGPCLTIGIICMNGEAHSKTMYCGFTTSKSSR